MYEQEYIIPVFERPYVTIHWDKVNNVVIAEWKDFVMGDNAREALDVGLNQVIKTGATRWLSDTRKLGVLTEPDKKWVVNDWFPRALGAGLNLMATVLSEKSVAQLGVSKIMKKAATDQLQQANFETVEDAHEWLITP